MDAWEWGWGVQPQSPAWMNKSGKRLRPIDESAAAAAGTNRINIFSARAV